MLDYRAIADGLAARYAPANVTPPAGRPNIRLATAQPPNDLAQFPSVVVFPGSGDLTYLPSRRTSTHDLTVNFYWARAAGDLARDYAALEDWLGVLLDQLHGATKLGLAGVVQKALVTRYEFGELVYGGTSYDGITLSVRIWTEEIVSLVAA